MRSVYLVGIVAALAFAVTAASLGLGLASAQMADNATMGNMTGGNMTMGGGNMTGGNATDATGSVSGTGSPPF
jgi:Spy/CpxP family protein refolding chaperone